MSSPSDILYPNRAGKQKRRFLSRFGRIAVLLAICVALGSFSIFAGYTPIEINDYVILALALANAVSILILASLVVIEAYGLFKARRAGVAGASLHIRIVGLFSIIAAAPALLMAWVGSVTLERSLNPSFMQDVRGFVGNTIEAAGLFQNGQCKSILQEARLTASDLDLAKGSFDVDRLWFHQFFNTRTRFLGFTTAALLKADGTIIDRIDTGAPIGSGIVQPENSDFEDARKNEPPCLIRDQGRTFVTLWPLTAFADTFLYVARPVDPFTVEFPREATRLVTLYDAFDSHRKTIQIAFAAMFISIALIMLLSATWFGLSFANQLVAPIRRLIAATDQVASGNLYVQVPVQKQEGDLGHLGETFNKMTSELRLQQNRLVAASSLIDERRLFTEAVLSGVPVAVIGVGPSGDITVLNSSAEKLVPSLPGDLNRILGQPLETVLPEIEPLLVQARASSARLVKGQVSVNRNGRDRLFNISITSEPSSRSDKSYVLTLDDITDLVSAQRTAAWADVARRIAHEIKNPLTPIQLSAERLKRKYGRLITTDRDIFDQCTDTIVRQVDDIKRMVDEFSSFARMPKARLEPDDLTECVRRVLFLMRVAHPGVQFEDHLPDQPIVSSIDRRLLSQALTNIIKNATEGIEARNETETIAGHIYVGLSISEVAGRKLAEIDIIDNGNGFPLENRQRLLEPYMTTRSEGTGLGLPIVAKILEDHGGSLELLDAPEGQGARVKLIFPLADLDHSSSNETGMSSSALLI
jgi:two-component system nitrogen regulation sensor histidine kinase NtrY